MASLDQIKNALKKQGVTKQVVQNRACILHNPVPKEGPFLAYEDIPLGAEMHQYTLSCNRFTAGLVVIDGIVYNHSRNSRFPFRNYAGYTVEYLFENFHRMVGNTRVILLVICEWQGTLDASHKHESWRNILAEKRLSGENVSIEKPG